MFDSYHRVAKLAGAAAVLTLASAFAPLFARNASADFILCRTDPVVVLSNGMVLDLTTSVADTAQDVKQINYTVNLPKGVTVSQVYYTPGPLSHVETVTSLSGNSAGAYDTTTTVTTGTSGLNVTATAVLVNAATFSVTGSGSTSGLSPQPLQITLSTN